MSLRNNLIISRQLGRSIARNTVDALRPARALPLAAEEVARPAFLNLLLGQHGLGEYRTLPAIHSARLLDTRPVSSNCNNRVIALTYAEAAGEAVLPPSMFLKMPVTSLTTMANPVCGS